MPARGKTKISPAQKAAVAIGKAAGKTNAEAAAAAGIAKSSADRIAADDRTKGIIDRIFAEKHGMLAGLMESVVESLKADIDPKSKLSPEQRFTARQQAVSVLQLGQPPAPSPAAGASAVTGGGVMLGDMLAVYRQIVTGAPGGE